MRACLQCAHVIAQSLFERDELGAGHGFGSRGIRRGLGLSDLAFRPARANRQAVRVVADVQVGDPGGHTDDQHRRRRLGPRGHVGQPLLATRQSRVDSRQSRVDSGQSRELLTVDCRLLTVDFGLPLRRSPRGQLAPHASHAVELGAARRARARVCFEGRPRRRVDIVVEIRDQRFIAIVEIRAHCCHMPHASPVRRLPRPARAAEPTGLGTTGFSQCSADNP